MPVRTKTEFHKVDDRRDNLVRREFMDGPTNTGEVRDVCTMKGVFQRGPEE